ncbi:hypothetical protein AB0953_17280 [Streptomyces sp. NPDC046866]|uniref:hypothetical protein n=1 Tax=Streptomyces sp. NPDC046866 TaxID=3154921 RepID=UPI003451BF8C
MGTADNLIRQGAGPAEGAEGAAPPEHWRYTRHLEALAAAAAGGPEAGPDPDAADRAEAAAVAEVLRDPDPVMAESAVVTHLDRRAARLLDDPRFPAWARALGAALGERAFPARRLREWALLKAIGAGEPWSAEDLTGASDWCQRTAAQLLTSYEALGLLAASARTRRVRNAAAGRLRRRSLTA